MTQAAVAHQQPSSSRSSSQPSSDDGRSSAPNGVPNGVPNGTGSGSNRLAVPPPTAPPSLVSAVKNLAASGPDLPQILRDRPAAAALAQAQGQAFDSPYARSGCSSTVPGSPRM